MSNYLFEKMDAKLCCLWRNRLNRLRLGNKNKIRGSKPDGNSSSGLHVDVLVAHPLGPVLGRLSLEGSSFLTEELQQRRLPDALDADDHQLQPRVRLRVLQDRPADR